jgi:hypothetical protein
VFRYGVLGGATELLDCGEVNYDGWDSLLRNWSRRGSLYPWKFSAV